MWGKIKCEEGEFGVEFVEVGKEGAQVMSEKE